jgi:hypothetical protein
MLDISAGLALLTPPLLPRTCSVMLQMSRLRNSWRYSHHSTVSSNTGFGHGTAWSSPPLRTFRTYRRIRRAPALRVLRIMYCSIFASCATRAKIHSIVSFMFVAFPASSPSIGSGSNCEGPWPPCMISARIRVWSAPPSFSTHRHRTFVSPILVRL